MAAYKPIPGQEANEDERKNLYFDDGVRRIDYVLVWEEFLDENKNQTPEEKRHKKFRDSFIKGLTNERVAIESTQSISEKMRIQCLKLHLPWELMCKRAEDMGLTVPLEETETQETNWSASLLHALHLPNPMQQTVPRTPGEYLTQPFKRNHLDRYLGHENHDTFFKPAQRHIVMNEILQNIVYGSKRRAQVGIEKCIHDGSFEAAYPLHEGTYPVQKDFEPEKLNNRQILYQYWARYGCWFRYQPLDHMRNYFGEKISFYFAWLGVYTAWLLAPTIAGIVVIVYAASTLLADPMRSQVCVNGSQFRMCPLCDTCRTWYLSETCATVSMARIFDSHGTVIFAVFISLWAVTFLESWKRRQLQLAHRWDTADFEESEEKPRPTYTALSPGTKVNPVTGQLEPYYPEEISTWRIVFGVGFIVILIMMVIIFIVAVIIYRTVITLMLFQWTAFNDSFVSRKLGLDPQLIGSMTSSCINLVFIVVMGNLYEIIAKKLTDWEMHRTQSEFDNNLTYKIFLFQFVNYYAAIVYLAFIRGKFTGYPGNYTKFLGLPLETCGTAGCMSDLTIQLIIVMIGKQIFNDIMELLMPKLKTWWHQFTSGLTVSSEEDLSKPRWLIDYSMISYEGLFEEYLEMVIQFGFVTIFVAAFPLAPLFALINNWVEIRLDSQKLVTETRRPLAERAENIGVWLPILQTITNLAVIANAFVIAFTSEELTLLLYYLEFGTYDKYVDYTLAYAPHVPTLRKDLWDCRYKDFRDSEGKHTMFFWKLMMFRLIFVLLFEHVLFFFGYLLDVLIPDVPEEIEIKIKRQKYLAKQALLGEPVKA